MTGAGHSSRNEFLREKERDGRLQDFISTPKIREERRGEEESSFRGRERTTWFTNASEPDEQSERRGGGGGNAKSRAGFVSH